MTHGGHREGLRCLRSTLTYETGREEAKNGAGPQRILTGSVIRGEETPEG